MLISANFMVNVQTFSSNVQILMGLEGVVAFMTYRNGGLSQDITKNRKFERLTLIYLI